MNGQSVTDAALRAATHLVSQRHGGMLTTFTFHRILRRIDPIMVGEPDVALFAEILDWIDRQFQVLEPLDACQRLSSGQLPPRAAAITFDDGYRSNLEFGVPLLRRHRMSAAIFVASDFVRGGTMFNDRVIHAIAHSRIPMVSLDWLGPDPMPLDSDDARRNAAARVLNAVVYLPPAGRNERVAQLLEACGVAEPGQSMMNADEIRRCVSAGITIGGHTRSHPLLSRLAPRDALDEIGGGREELRAITGTDPLLFAYPNGRYGRDFSQAHCDIVKHCGFRFAFTTDIGWSSRRTDPFRLRRIAPWGTKRLRFGLQVLRVAGG